MFDLTGKVALVTGARRGMGKAHAKALAEQGAKVAITDINLNDCEEAASGISGEVACYKLDVAREDEVDQVIGQVVQKFGRLDILVNNAGIFESKEALEMTLEEWERTIRVNLTGQFLCAKHAAKEMMKNKWGRIINIASIASGGAGIGIEQGAHYTASKGGIIGLSATLALELAKHGILVNVIAPGAIDTPMLTEAGTDEAEMAGWLKRIPLGRIGKPEEVAAAVVFLASDEASYLTGSTLYIDGGWTVA